MKVGRILGFEIRVDPSWFIIFVLLAYSLSMGFFPDAVAGLPELSYWMLGLAASLLLFASVLLHELSHSLVGRHYGMEISGITLFIFGGVARLKSEPRSPRVELLMTLAGPAMSLLLALLFWAASSLPGLGPPGAVLLGYLSFINLGLALFNLLPGFPLDGGRVVRALIWWATGDIQKATHVASLAGQGIGLLMIGFGVTTMVTQGLGGLWIAFIGWFVITAARQSYQQIVLQGALAGVEVGRVMDAGYPHVSPTMPLQELVEEFLVRQGYRQLPVVEDERPVGMVSLGEIRGVAPSSWATTRVGEVMTPLDRELLIGEHEDSWNAIRQLADVGAPRLLVMREGRVVGLVSRETLTNLLDLRLRATT